MNFNCLIPELRVSDIKKSKNFYSEILGFKVEYERKDFAMMVQGDCQIMLQQLILPSKEGSWNVSDDMKHPFGRGINLQIIYPDISQIYCSLKRHKKDIFIDLLISDYLENGYINHVLEFLVQDPDGYLLRFQQDVKDFCVGNDKETADRFFDMITREENVSANIYKENAGSSYMFSILTNWDRTDRIVVLTKKEYLSVCRQCAKQGDLNSMINDKNINKNLILIKHEKTKKR